MHQIPPRFFGAFAIREVDRHAHVTDKLAPRRISGDAPVQNPTIFSVPASQSIFHFEWHSRVERRIIDIHTSAEVVGMHTLRPPISEFLLHRASGEFKPVEVEKITEL